MGQDRHDQNRKDGSENHPPQDRSDHHDRQNPDPERDNRRDHENGNMDRDRDTGDHA